MRTTLSKPIEGQVFVVVNYTAHKKSGDVSEGKAE
jgi:hypothetical protein